MKLKVGIRSIKDSNDRSFCIELDSYTTVFSRYMLVTRAFTYSISKYNDNVIILPDDYFYFDKKEMNVVKSKEELIRTLDTEKEYIVIRLIDLPMESYLPASSMNAVIDEYKDIMSNYKVKFIFLWNEVGFIISKNMILCEHVLGSFELDFYNIDNTSLLLFENKKEFDLIDEFNKNDLSCYHYLLNKTNKSNFELRILSYIKNKKINLFIDEGR